MKIRINIKYLNKIKKFHSNKFFKKKYLNEIEHIQKYSTINILNILKKINGINNSNAFFLSSLIGISPFTSLYNIKKHTNYIFKQLEFLLINSKIVFGKDVNITKRNYINNLKKINNYRGIRHMHFLPTRGQKTYANAKTRKKFHIS